MVMVGADADALDAAAGELDAAAAELASSAGGLGGLLGGLAWIGQVASAFVGLWNSDYKPRLGSTAQFIEQAADELRRQARQQRDASNSDGTSSGGIWGDVMRRFDELVERFAEQRKIADALAPALAAARQMSPADQLAWWNSLTPEQQAALLAMRPGELTALDGLPPDVLGTARENYFSSIAEEIETGSAMVKVEGKLDIKIVRVGAGFEFEQTSFADGHVELSFGAFAKAGVGLDDVALVGMLGAGAVYTFSSQQEANEFLDGLKKAVIPSVSEGAWGLVPVLGAGLVADDAMADAARYLSDHSDHLDEISIEAGVEGSIGAGGAKVSESAGVEVSRKTNGDVTVTAKHSFSGELKEGTLGVTGDVEMSASATFDGDGAKSISFDMTYENAALGGAFSEVSEIGSGVATAGSAHVTFDLRDPAVASAASAATDALKRGDVQAATRALSGVMDRAEIVVQTQVGATSVVGFDAKVVSGSAETKLMATTTTLIKPPGGAFYEVEAH
jgi:hypothetical protein